MRLADPTGTGQSVEDRAFEARLGLWRRRPGLRNVLIRRGAVLRDGGAASPLQQVATSRGAAVQVLLLALFAAQCRPPRSAGQPTPIPLREAPPDGTSWLHLTALATARRTGVQSYAREADQNRSTQIFKAMKRLHAAGRITSTASRRDQFAGFSLLDEVADNRRSQTAYRVPKADEDVIEVPVEFFLNGWVHTLEDSEILTLLFLLYATAQARHAGTPEGWVDISSETWASQLGKRSWEAPHRMLKRYGLLEVRRPEARRADGTVAAGDERPWTAHSYRAVPENLAYLAKPTTDRALRIRHDLDLDESVLVLRDDVPLIGRPREVDGWTWHRAHAELEDDKLAAPVPPRRV